MFRTYRLTPTTTRYTPILEIIRRRAEELEREAAAPRGKGPQRTPASHAFSATA